MNTNGWLNQIFRLQNYWWKLEVKRECSLAADKMAGRAADPWADVDFDEIMDATCLEMDDIKVLFNCFQLFDTKKQDYLLADDIDEVMR